MEFRDRNELDLICGAPGEVNPPDRDFPIFDCILTVGIHPTGDVCQERLPRLQNMLHELPDQVLMVPMSGKGTRLLDIGEGYDRESRDQLISDWCVG